MLYGIVFSTMQVFQERSSRESATYITDMFNKWAKLMLKLAGDFEVVVF